MLYATECLLNGTFSQLPIQRFKPFEGANSMEANLDKILREFYVFFGTGVYGYPTEIDSTVDFEELEKGPKINHLFCWRLLSHYFTI